MEEEFSPLPNLYRAPAKGKVSHVNSIVSEYLGILLNNYDAVNRYNLIDYLSEWGMYLPREKHIIEIVAEKFTADYRKISNSNKEENDESALRLYISKIFKENSRTAEEFMENFLGEKEWNGLIKKLDKRDTIEKVKDFTTITKEIAIAASRNIEGGHYSKKNN